MLSHVHSEQLLTKAKVARLSSNALVFNNLANNYTLTDLTKQVIRSNTHL
jgi:hypothetical protein